MNYRNVRLNSVAALVLGLLGVAFFCPGVGHVWGGRTAGILGFHRGSGVSLPGWLLYGRWR